MKNFTLKLPTVADKLSAMIDSMDLVNVAIKKDKTDASKDLVERNVLHLEQMLALPEIKSDPSSKVAFTIAIQNGRSFLK